MSPPGRLGTLVSHRWQLLSAAAFVLVNVVLWWDAPADDWSSLYVAAAVLGNGDVGALYAHDPTFFHVVADPAWRQAAADSGFAGFLHPYVQVPLLAYALEPLTRVVSFTASAHAVLLVNALSLAALTWLSGLLLDRRLLRPHVYAGALVVLTVSEPVRYSLFLGQTTPVIVCASVLALHLARRGRPLPAGLLLAVVTCIKLTPALVALYWLLTPGHRRAAAWFAGWTVALSAASLVVAGPAVTAEYVATLRRISAMALPGFNNQSLVAWAVGERVPAAEAFTFRTFPLPGDVRLVNVALAAAVVLAVAAVALVLRRRGEPDTPLVLPALFLVPLVFSPVSWTHYYVVMLLPVLALVRLSASRRQRWPAAVAVVVVVLNLQPTAFDPVTTSGSAGTLLRSHLLSALLALGALLVAALLRDAADDSSTDGRRGWRRSLLPRPWARPASPRPEAATQSAAPTPAPLVAQDVDGSAR